MVVKKLASEGVNIRVIKHLGKVPLLRDPLVHFVLIGALLFLLDGMINHDSKRDEIVVTASRLEHLAAVFERSWQRPPSRQELQQLVDNYVREEILYREALKLGLEQDDTVIRRRLRLKMEFLARDLVDAIEPAPEVLEQFYHDHAERYRQPARWSFRQVFFSADTRRSPAGDAKKMLTELHAGERTAVKGDSHLLPRQFARASAGEVDKQLGNGFSSQLQGLPIGQWIGPIMSEYGAHLVFVEDRVAGAPPEFAHVRAQVLRDWQAQQHTNVLERQYQLLRQDYRVLLQDAGSADQPSDAASAAEVAVR